MGITQLKKPLVASLRNVATGVNVPWRKTGFRSGPCFQSGVLDLAPAWFQAAQAVSDLSFFFVTSLSIELLFRDSKISFKSQQI